MSNLKSRPDLERHAQQDRRTERDPRARLFGLGRGVHDRGDTVGFEFGFDLGAGRQGVPQQVEGRLQLLQGRPAGRARFQVLFDLGE